MNFFHGSCRKISWHVQRRSRDTAHLRLFRSDYSDCTRAALLLHDGDTIEWMAPGIQVAPGGALSRT